MNQES